MSRSCSARRSRRQGPTYEISPPTHRRVPWDAGGRFIGRPHGEAHPRASDRDPEISPLRFPVARVQASQRGTMRFPRRAPREVYRLFDEDEYLAGATWEPGEPDSGSVDVRSSTDSRWPRIVSAAVLLGTTGAVGGLVLLNSLAHPRGSGRRPGVRTPSGTVPKTVSTRPSRAYPHDEMPTRQPPPSWAIARARQLRRSRFAVAEMTMAASSARVTTSAYVASETAHQAEFGFER